MPNWCSNTVEIYHPDHAKLKALMEAFKEGKFCNHIIPVPEDLQITAGFLGDEDKQRQLEEQEKINFAKYGAKNWYDFCVARWGTKWDVTDECGSAELADGANDITISFESAWAPPVGVYEAMVEQGYSVRAYYYEPGMAFVGVWWDGDDQCYDYSGCTSKTVVETIGEELDEMFGISEVMAEYEEEDEEA